MMVTSQINLRIKLERHFYFFLIQTRQKKSEVTIKLSIEQ